MSLSQTISARWLAPVSSPPIEDGIVSFANGQITYVGPTDGRKIDQQFDNAILLPGLVNAHTHLDLTRAKGLTPPLPSFCAWLNSVIAYRKSRTSEQVRADVASGVMQCLASGTTLIGDIAVGVYDYGPLNALAFQELIGLSEERCNAAIDSWRAAGFIPAGVSPHAPYSFRFSRLDALPGIAPFAMHVAESREEIELVRSRSGPMRAFLEEIGAWDESGLPPSFDATFRCLKRRLEPVLLIHANYLEDNAAIPPHSTIVYCPRTHAAFGHPPHPFRQFLSRGIRVVLATDSLASNPDLSVLAEARFVARHHPDFDVETVLNMITAWPADALSLAFGPKSGYKCGAIVDGNRADFCVVELPSKCTQPLPALLNEDTPIRAVFTNGMQRI